jgi:hypothetical protein
MANPFINEIAPGKVQVTSSGVALFNAQWPCSELRSTRSYWFEFSEEGDLIDCDVPEHDDGSAATAMAEDAANFLLLDRVPEWCDRG